VGMQIYRFDEEYSIPITHFGSDFRLAPLFRQGNNMQAQVMHLGPGGLIGRHPADVHQLFCVVSGSGWVRGGEGPRRVIAAGEAAGWEPGEEHEVGTDVGLMAVCFEGEFETVSRSVLREIEVLDYDPSWAEWFRQVHDFVWPAMVGLAIRIEHVGSTSVPGLAAKPIIDMDIVVAAEADVAEGIERVRSLGYRWMGELGVPGRQAFILDSDTSLPAHHLYLVVENNRAHQDHWLLRELLRVDPDARQRYGDLKRSNVELAAGDIDAYGRAKAALVAELLTRARAERGLEPVEYWQPEVRSPLGDE
jgi:GrpB-like predicted nucleotidyltransferase (UPF0157 family)/quercetin dioxygenase-like cupin family protein